MGKTRKKGQRSHSKYKSQSTVECIKKADIAEYLALADFHLESCQLKLALKYTKKALKIDSKCNEALELHGILLFETDNPKGAIKYLQRAVEIYPNDGFTKYLYLGDLLSGIDAVNCFKKAIQLIENNFKLIADPTQDMDAANFIPQNSEHNENVLKDEISMAYCSIAEIYLTDFEELSSENVSQVVSENCLHACQKALEYNEKSAEAYQIMASYWISMNYFQTARECAYKSIEYLSIPLTEKSEVQVAESEDSALDANNTENGATIDDVDAVSSKSSEIEETEDDMDPESFFVKLNLAKVLIELNELPAAVDVLDNVLQIEDEVIEVWYLLGWVYYVTGDREEAMTSLEYASKLSEQYECNDAQMLQHIRELIEEMHTQVANNGHQVSEENIGNNLEMEA